MCSDRKSIKTYLREIFRISMHDFYFSFFKAHKAHTRRVLPSISINFLFYGFIGAHNLIVYNRMETSNLLLSKVA